MNRFLILSVGLGLGMLQAACGSSKTTATSSGSAACVAASDAYIVSKFPAVTIDPNILTLYAQLEASQAGSGDATFSAVTTTIVANALAASPNDVGNSFQTKLADATTERQTEFTLDLKNFLASAFGGPAYPTTAPTMADAHSDLDITVSQYNAFISGVVVPALTTNGVSTDTIAQMAPVVTDPNFVKTVVTCQ